MFACGWMHGELCRHRCNAAPTTTIPCLQNHLAHLTCHATSSSSCSRPWQRDGSGMPASGSADEAAAACSCSRASSACTASQRGGARLRPSPPTSCRDGRRGCASERCRPTNGSATDQGVQSSVQQQQAALPNASSIDSTRCCPLPQRMLDGSSGSPPPVPAGTPQPSAAPAPRGSRRLLPPPAAQTCFDGDMHRRCGEQRHGSTCLGGWIFSPHNHTGAAECRRPSQRLLQHASYTLLPLSPRSPPREGHQQHSLPGGKQRRLPRQHLGVCIVLLRKLQHQPAEQQRTGGEVAME